MKGNQAPVSVSRKRLARENFLGLTETNERYGWSHRLIFQVKLFTNLHLLSVFIILGIGADDVFVFTDAWVQAGVVLGEDADLVKRLSWTYRRASKAVLITYVNESPSSTLTPPMLSPTRSSDAHTLHALKLTS